jgi:hypothetical protein
MAANTSCSVVVSWLLVGLPAVSFIGGSFPVSTPIMRSGRVEPPPQLSTTSGTTPTIETVRHGQRSCRVVLERLEGGDLGLVALVDGAAEAVVGGFLGDLRSTRENRSADGRARCVAIVGEPLPSVFFEPMAGAVVDDEEDLAARKVADQLLG